jgi:hypothetical protein
MTSHFSVGNELALPEMTPRAREWPTVTGNDCASSRHDLAVVITRRQLIKTTAFCLSRISPSGRK